MYDSNYPLIGKLVADRRHQIEVDRRHARLPRRARQRWRDGRQRGSP